MKIRLSTATALLSLLLFMSACSSSQRGVIVLCAGDSITASSFPRYLLKIISSEGIRANVLNYGQNGNTSGEYLSYLKANTKNMAAKHPDYILIQLGTNDVRRDHDSTSQAQFYANMKAILRIFRRFQNPDGKRTQIFLATIPPIPNGIPFPFSTKSQQRVVEEINPTIKQIGREENISVVDNYSLFMNNPELLHEIHPTEEGYRRLARNWFMALKPFLLKKFSHFRDP
ncbi:MAG: SGNH/GDSL hydrolase family protein [Candidatus Aminicenantes bacterium]|jgi:lysophospholipase L1-like esterase